MSRTNRISPRQFSFEHNGSGCYKVTYTTANRGDYYVAQTNELSLVDEVLHEEAPTQEAMARLRRVIKLRGSHYNKSGESLD